MEKSFVFDTKSVNNFAEAAAVTYCHTFAIDEFPDTECKEYDFQPPDQPDGVRPYEHDVLAGYASTIVKNWGTNAAGQGEFVVVKTNYTTLLSLGDNESVDSEAECTSFGRSHAEVSVDSFAFTNVITGKTIASGTNHTVRTKKYHKSYAFSAAMLEAIVTNVVKGEIKAKPVYRSRSRGPGETKNFNQPRDPITFRLRDLTTGDVTNGLFFRVTMEMLPGPDGETSWETNEVRIASSNCSFRVEMPGPFTAAAGALQLEVRDGVLLQADATGIYAGAPPPLGMTVPFSFPFPNEQVLDFDLSSIAGTTNVELAVDLSTLGQVVEEYSEDGPALAAALVHPGVVTLSWPVSGVPFQLQSSPVVAPLPAWANVNIPPLVEGGRFVVNVPLNPEADFFRLESMEVGACHLAVTGQPVDAYGLPGETVSWSVAVSSAPSPPAFQWQRMDNQGIFVDIPDATDSLLSWVISIEDRGAQFRCRISNDCETVTSLPAKLIVNN